MGKAEPGQDRGGARRRRMGADVGEPRLDLGDAVRVGRGLRLGEQRGCAAIGGEHHLKQGFRAVGCFLRQPADGGTRRPREAARSTAISPAMARNRVDLPVPLRPTSPTRAPAGICADARSIKSRPATRSDTSSITSMGRYGRIGGRYATGSSPPRGHPTAIPGGMGCQNPVAGATIRATAASGRAAATKGMEMCVAGCERAVREALTRRGFFRGAAATGLAATAVTGPAVAAPRTFTRAVDLTHTMSPEFPTFNGKPGIEMQREFVLKKDGYNLSWWHVSEHAGTHMDAPIHFSEHGAPADKLAIDQLVVPLAVVDIAYKAEQDADYLLSRDDLARGKARTAGCRMAAASRSTPAGASF